MAIVIAQRRREQILILSDTMISNPMEKGPDVFQGRLKVVTIGPCVTIAYAGNADPASVAVREAREQLRRTGLAVAVDVLKQASRDGLIDFLVASHRLEASLLRIRRGVALDVKDICAIGHEEPFQSLIEQARFFDPTETLKDSNLRFRFSDRLMTNKDLGPSVGGLPIAVQATASDHRYLFLAGTYTYEFPPLRPGEQVQQPIEQVYTGRGHFGLYVVPSQAVNTPVVGGCLLQARMGYVFSPIEKPEAFRVPLLPSTVEWEGHEQQMLEVLQRELATHVGRVRLQSLPERSCPKRHPLPASFHALPPERRPTLAPSTDPHPGECDIPRHRGSQRFYSRRWLWCFG